MMHISPDKKFFIPLPLTGGAREANHTEGVVQLSGGSIFPVPPYPHASNGVNPNGLTCSQPLPLKGGAIYRTAQEIT